MVKLNPRFHRSIPLLTVTLACLIEFVLLPSQSLFIFFDKMILYFWLLYRPDLLSFLYLFLLYLVIDVLQGWPLGFNPLLVVIFVWTVLAQRHWAVNKEFSLQWLLLAGCITIYTMVFAFLVWVFDDRLISAQFLGSALLGVLSYPLISRVLYRLYLVVPTAKPVKA